MPAVLDLAMATALGRAGIPFYVVVHDADPHPGDDVPFQMMLQNALLRRASGLIALSGHVATRLRQRDLVGERALVMTSHPPFVFGARPPPPRAHGGKLRLLSFGRLLPYKGLDLLAEALQALGPRDDLDIRVVGQGPHSPELAILAGLPNVTVENRWVPEDEVGALLAWSDALILSHREASQSGVAAAAIAARRWIVATRVGGITEQLAGEPLARMCEPDAGSVATAIASLVVDPPVDTAEHDPRAIWHDVAVRLVRDLSG
jgi:glycosyltransferase involved in cell wall biosynthesis